VLDWGEEGGGVCTGEEQLDLDFARGGLGDRNLCGWADNSSDMNEGGIHERGDGRYLLLRQLLLVQHDSFHHFGFRDGVLVRW
jgi:hypothetical protein